MLGAGQLGLGLLWIGVLILRLLILARCFLEVSATRLTRSDRWTLPGIWTKYVRASLLDAPEGHHPRMDVEALDEATQSLASRVGLVLAALETQPPAEDADAFFEAWLQFPYLEPPPHLQGLDLALLGRLVLSQLERFFSLAFVTPRPVVIEVCTGILHGFWILLVVATR